MTEGSVISEVHGVDDAARLYAAAMGSLDRAVFGEEAAKRALLVAIAGRFALAITGWTGGGKTLLVEQGLRLLSDLEERDVAWIPTFGMFPGWLLDGRERVVPGKDKTVTQRELSMLEQRPSTKALVFDMLDVIDGPSDGKELWRFANKLAEPWAQRIVPVEPHLTHARLLVSTWIPSTGRHPSQAPTNMRRLHHVAVVMGHSDEAVAARLIDEHPEPAIPVGSWSAFDGVDRVAREEVRLGGEAWERAGLAADRQRLGAARSEVTEHAARILAAYGRRDAVAPEDLVEAVGWSRMASEC